MVFTRYSRHIALLLMTIFLVCGCGQDKPAIDRQDTPIKIEFCLAPGTPAQVNITRIEFTVSNSETGESRDFQRIDLDPEERNAGEKILRPILPTGEPLTFSVKAFDSDCPVLGGSQGNVILDPVENNSVVIELSSTQIVIGVRSDQEQVRPGDTFALEVYVEDVCGLSAFTCELGFSEGLLEPMQIEPGDLFTEKENFLFLEDSEFPNKQEGNITLAFAQKADNRGLYGSGTAFRLTFRAAGTGTAYVELLDNDAFTMLNDAYEDIRNSAQVRLEPNISIKIE